MAAERRATPSAGSRTGGRVAVGHPVDVASGTLFHTFEDYAMPGRMPLAMSRRYSTALLDAETIGMFGVGWSSPFEVRLLREPDAFLYVDESGESAVAFPCDAAGELPDGGVLNPGSFAELSRAQDELVVTRWDVDTGVVTRDVFPAADAMAGDEARIVRRERAGGAAIEFGYSRSSGLLKHVVQRRERRGLQLRYDEGGRVVRVDRRSRRGGAAGAAEAVLHYGYDDAGRLRSVIDPEGNRASYEYDAHGRMTRETTLAGKQWRFVYDELGRCVVTTAAQRFDYHRLDYGRPGRRMTTVTDTNGAVTCYHFNEYRQVTRVTSPLGHAESTLFDAAGRIVQQSAADGVAIGYEYDEAGNRSVVRLGDGGEIRLTHGEDRQVRSIVDQTGAEWTFAYDERGALVSATTPGGVERRWRYDAAGDPIARGVGETVLERYRWDEAGNLASLTDADGHRYGYRHDAFGGTIGYTDPVGRTTVVERDVRGRARRVVFPDRRERAYEWDVFGNMTRYTDELGRETRWSYCLCGNLEEVVAPDGARTSFGWNAVPGQLAAITNELGEVHSFDYDADGRLVREIDFAGRETRYARDGSDRVVRIERSSGRVLLLAYDAADRPVRISDPESDEEVLYEYDARGRLVGGRLGGASVRLEFDVDGRLTAERGAEHEWRHEHDALNRRVARRSAEGEATAYVWSAAGWLESVSAPGAAPLVLGHDEAGHECRRACDGVAELLSSCNADGQPIEQRLRLDGRDHRRRYDYDPCGDLIAREDAASRPERFTLDEVGRATAAAHASGHEERLDYDLAGNVTARTLTAPAGSRAAGEGGSAVTASELVHAPGSVVERVGETRLEYDADGRLVARHDAGGTTRFRWSFLDFLVGVETPDGARWRYDYDALGRRVRKVGPDSVHRFEWDGDDLCAETIERDGERERILWEHHPHDGSLLYTVQRGALHLAVCDQIGAPALFVGPGGRRSWRRHASLFGTSLQDDEEGGLTCALRFPGQYHDRESGLFYNRFRYYSPDLCAYVTDDPAGFDGGVNPRRYVHNPLGWIDPLGLMGLMCRLGKWKKTFVGMRIVAALLGDDPKTPYTEVVDQIGSAGEITALERARQAGRGSRSGESAPISGSPPPPPPDPPDPTPGPLPGPGPAPAPGSTPPSTPAPGAAPSPPPSNRGPTRPPQSHPPPRNGRPPRQPHVDRFGRKGPSRAHKWR